MNRTLKDATVRRYHYKTHRRVTDGDFPPPLLADLAATLSTASPGARLQLDLKDTLAPSRPNAIAGFAAAVSPVALLPVEWRRPAGCAAARCRGSPAPTGLRPFELGERRTFDRAADIETFVAEVLEIAPTAHAFYLHHAFVTEALMLGHNPIKQLKANGAFVDVWTLDPTAPDISEVLHLCIAAGADQITTNDPPGLARLWRNAGLT